VSPLLVQSGKPPPRRDLERTSSGFAFAGAVLEGFMVESFA